jgi:ATP-dependent RNA helicase RhlE
MLDMGFLPAINTIVASAMKERQTLMFSAHTLREIENLTKQFQRSPKLIEVGRRSNPAETVTQLLYECPTQLKQVMLNQLLKDETMQMVLVFARTKHGADRICRKLEAEKFTVQRFTLIVPKHNVSAHYRLSKWRNSSSRRY